MQGVLKAIVKTAGQIPPKSVANKLYILDFKKNKCVAGRIAQWLQMSVVQDRRTIISNL